MIVIDVVAIGTSPGPAVRVKEKVHAVTRSCTTHQPTAYARCFECRDNTEVRRDDTPHIFA